MTSCNQSEAAQSFETEQNIIYMYMLIHIQYQYFSESHVINEQHLRFFKKVEQVQDGRVVSWTLQLTQFRFVAQGYLL